MANFDKSIHHILANEGGDIITNDPTDRGGLTKYGISQRAYPEIDIENLTEEQAKGIYKKDYWDAVRGDDIKRQIIAVSIFDFAVNAGPGVAKKLAQKAIGVKSDGVIGPITLSSLITIPIPLFLYKYAIEKIKYYRDIVSKNPSQKKFLLGWINRSLEGL